jgi:3-oxoacyl-[acyl-carrier protein] reductase
MTGLRDKAALVTGGSRGIGKAIVGRLAGDGAAVVFGYLSSADAAAAIVAQITAAGGSAHAIQADLSDTAAAVRLYREAEQLVGPLDILVNNAGAVAGDLIADTTDEALDVTALELLSRVAAYELGERGITVNSVLPGATDTELFRDNNLEESRKALLSLTALGRIGEPADIADVVAFLAGDDGRWITGQSIRAAGGLLA